MIRVMIKVIIMIRGGLGLGPGPTLIMSLTSIMTLIMMGPWGPHTPTRVVSSPSIRLVPRAFG